MTEIKKLGVRLPLTFEAILQSAPEPRPGRYRKLTPEEKAQWREARAALKRLERSPWVEWDHEDGYVIKEPRKWVSDE